MKDENNNEVSISIDKKNLTVNTILDKLNQGTIILAPDFKRHFVWDQVKKSRLIESLMYKIPIPMFYVASDAAGTFAVVDGSQRINAIRDYIGIYETFRLRGLELSKEYEHFMFKHLPINIQKTILETELTFVIINPGTAEDIKKKILKRITY